MITRSCGCEPADVFGDDDISEHDGDCPRYWDHLGTAGDIATARDILMRWDENAGRLYAEGNTSFGNHRETTARMGRGVTARAVELGLETP
jgi:hypothetical protein